MKIDIIKKIDRIALLLALIVMVIASIAGALSYQKRHSVRIRTGLTDDFHEYVKQEYRKEIDKTLKQLDKVYGAIFDSDVRYANKGLGRTGLYQGEVFEYKYSRPPLWRVTAVGFIHAVLGFGATLLCIRLTARGIKRLSLYIDGAKDKNKEDKEAV